MGQHLTCPACDGTALFSFYEQKNVPVNSCLLVDSYTQALEFPTGNLSLAACESCGFVFNTIFDEGLVEYSSRYEETQGFSAHFRDFAEKLAQRWIDKYDIHDKDILEIGCGKAEFLALMCKLGGNRGLGVDPSAHPERVDPELRDQLTLSTDFFGAQYGPIDADVVVCRHTLEHIAPVGTFMRDLRDALEGRPDAIVLFELPDVLRVLREAAFWDVYHEHCSYFSPGSLARLFRASGFEVKHLELDFDGQYILIEAVPAPRPHEAAPLPLEETPAEVVAAAAHFGTTVESERQEWRTLIRAAAERSENPVIWGAGSKGVSFLCNQEPGTIAYAVDINPYKHDKFMAGTGQQVVSPEFLLEHPSNLVVVMNPVYTEEIRAQLNEMGLQPEISAV